MQHLEVSTRALADSNEVCDGGRKRKGAKKKGEEKEEEGEDDDDDEDGSTQQQEPFNECTHARDSKQLFDEWQKKNAFHIVIIRQQSPPCTLNPPLLLEVNHRLSPPGHPRGTCVATAPVGRPSTPAARSSTRRVSFCGIVSPSSPRRLPSAASRASSHAWWAVCPLRGSSEVGGWWLVVRRRCCCCSCWCCCCCCCHVVINRFC